MYDVVKAIRQRPFGEYNIVYYNAAQTSPEKLFERLQSNRCPQAARVESAPVDKGGVRVRLGNGLATPGDLFHIEVILPAGRSGTVKVAAPEGWSVPTGAACALKAGPNRCDVQAPATAKPGAQQVSVWVKLSSGEVMEFPLRLELVNRVK